MLLILAIMRFILVIRKIKNGEYGSFFNQKDDIIRENEDASEIAETSTA